MPDAVAPAPGDAPPRTVLAAGGVLWRPLAGRDGAASDGVPAIELALVHRPRYDDWSLPKGKAEPGELPIATAVREVAEETGARARPGRRLGRQRYQVPDGDRIITKTVRYWAMEYLDGEFTPNDEVDRLDWLSPAAAFARLTWARDRTFVQRLVAGALQTTTVLLARHGHAGSRSAWHGPDDARPLDARGREQAEGLVALAAAYRVERVVSAPLVRCRDTVAPAAAALGLAVTDDPRLAEDYPEPDGVRSALLDYARRGRPTLACSQGGVIPEALLALQTAAGLPADGTRARKGSVWALAFAGQRLVDAEYLPSAVPRRERG
ncbi:MAG: hydrolase [Mycobacterium sp.]|nr:hydrolase [Mycobacterium sp.]